MKELRESEKKYLEHLEYVRAEERRQSTREWLAWREAEKERKQREFVERIKDAIYVVIHKLDENKKPSGPGKRWEVLWVVDSQGRDREYQLGLEDDDHVHRVCYAPSTRARAVITSNERIEYHYYMEER